MYNLHLLIWVVCEKCENGFYYDVYCWDIKYQPVPVTKMYLKCADFKYLAFISIISILCTNLSFQANERGLHKYPGAE